MFFKSMEIQGFKSFADKTVLNFDTKMTAIVGSNGNGKSNISDALRWVMGEQGAKTLRGDKMEDVIFHGTVQRKPMGFAKVSLTIDNTDRALAVDSDEVVITRKLYRTGDSEYIINNRKSRLKDIQELLMGTGLGRDGYSIIGQGRVAEVINSKGSQRRELFEEAAGVSKFLHQKAEAERDLSRAEDNILRLKDISTELEERLPVLEKQAEKAVKARGLLEQEKTLEISVNVADLERLDKELLEIDDKILVNQGECEHFQREIGQLEEENEALNQQKMLNGAKLDKLRQSGEWARDEIAAADREIAVLENEIVHNGTRTEQIKNQSAESAKGTEELDRQIEALKQEIADKEKYLAENDKNAAALQEKLTALTEENQDLDSRYKELDRKQGLFFAHRTAAKLAIGQAEASLEELNSQLAASEERIDNQEGLLEEYRSKRRSLSAQLDALAEEKQETENKVGGYSRLFAGKKEKLDGAKDEYEKIRREYEQKRSRHEILSDVEKNMEGYNNSVKAVITAARRGQLGDIYGTVADIIHVEKKYSVAIEVALGAALQNIIVKNEETAKRCIRHLKDTGGGRATFLPLTSIKGNPLSVNGLEKEEGFEGIGSDLVQCDEQYKEIIRYNLGRTAIVEDIDTATVIAKKYGYKFRIITLDGQIINAGGSFTGGSLSNKSGIISRKQELDELEKQLEKLADTMELSKGSFSELQAETDKMSIEIEGYKEQLTKLQQDEVRLTAEIAGVKELIAQCEEQQDNAETVLNRHRAQIKGQEQALQKAQNDLAEADKSIEALAEELKEAGATLENSAAKRQEISDKISALNIEKLTGQKDIENLNGKISSVEESKKNIGEGNIRLEGEIAELAAKSERLKTDIETKRQEIEKLNSTFSQGRADIEQAVAEGERLERRISEIAKEIREKIEDKEKFSNALVVAKEKKEAAQKECDKIKSGLWEKYELAPTEAYSLAQELPDVNAAKAQLADIRRRLSALGNVNYASIEEFDEVSARYKELAGQLEDVEKSKRELERLIANLTADIKARFLASFNDINEHFQRIFVEVFGGGSAHLELTDPDDVLNSGIEIFAAPPGKLIKNLISLSGGEQTMVAITIYFAILLHRPTPFCMLDEVDAALDEVNVVKYITYLKRFSKQTQLMVITHRRGTIEGCDVLYGVFMQEKGVSRLLKQEIIDDLDLEIS